MKELIILQKEKTINGTLVSYEIRDGEVFEFGTRLVPHGFDRLLIPHVEGALSAYI